MAKVEEIVRLLATMPEPLNDGVEPRVGWCWFCEADYVSPSGVPHEPSCPWRQAAEWVANHPTPNDGRALRDRCLVWWDADREPVCELTAGHIGPHWDGRCWFGDDRHEVKPPAVSA